MDGDPPESVSEKAVRDRWARRVGVANDGEAAAAGPAVPPFPF